MNNSLFLLRFKKVISDSYFWLKYCGARMTGKKDADSTMDESRVLNLTSELSTLSPEKQAEVIEQMLMLVALAAACIARSGKLDRARSRLYRGQILQENMRLKALAEIYTMHSFAQLGNLIFFCQNFAIFFFQNL